MPAEKCNNGKWKWGATGACKYDSKQEAEKDNENYYRDVEDIDLTPTKGMVEEAIKGKEWRKEFGRGGTEVGLKSANMIINNELTIERVKKMYAYFQRHEVDKQGEGFTPDEDGFPSAGRIAWALWGGDAGMSWSTKKRNQIANETEENREQVGTIISDGIELPLFDTIEEAENEAENLGGSGYHEHTVDGTVYYMPFSSHEEAKEALKKEDKKLQTKVWDKKFNTTIMEKRIFNIENRFETKEDGQEVVIGYGSIWNSRSENLGGFYEFISPSAITEETIAKSDVRALINHDPNLVLARSTAGNLKLSVDDKGLKYEFSIPETSYGKDLAINMKNGNINQSSFAFTVGSDEWSTDDEGNDIRTITSIDRLYDVSPVTYPAYSQAESDLVVAQRGLAMYKEKQEIKEEENDLVARSLAKLKIELIKRTK